MNAPAVLIKLSQRFHTLRRRHMAVQIGIASSLLVVALLGAWGVLAGCDYVWELPLTTRRVAAAVVVVGILLGFSWQIYRIVRGTRARSFATLLEKSFEPFGQRIRTVLDTVAGRVEGPAVMLTALGHQTLGRWETTTPERIVPLRKLLIGVFLVVLASVGVAVLFFTSDQWQTALLRSTGRDLPYTTFHVQPGNHSILEGLPVEVALTLDGRIQRDVTLRYHSLPFEAAGEISSAAEKPAWVELELLPSESNAALFTAQLGKAARPLEYQFVTSAGETELFRIDVRPRIEARRIVTTVSPPAYTRLESRLVSDTDVTALALSRVEVTIETNHPLHQAELTIMGQDTSTLLENAPSEDRRQWTFELPCLKSLSWQFTGYGQDQTPLKPVSGRLRVQTDQAPSLTWRSPTQELRVSTLTEVPLQLLVSDDFGVQETGIVFQLGGEEEYELANWTESEQENAAPPTTRLRLEETLPLESLALTERDYIAYYAYAIDNHQPNPSRVESDVRYIDIRPLRQFFSEIELPPNNGGGGSVVVQLDEIIRRQRFMINRTRRLTKATGEDLTQQLRTIDRLVENQSELAGVARFLAEFLISQGNDDVEALNQAEATMLQASDSLAAANFDLALVQQEDALRSLAEARRTVELAINKGQLPFQRQALRRFNQQMRQKLRLNRPQSPKQLADSLQQIARQQRMLAVRAQKIGPDTPEEEGDELYADQIDLLERVRTIENDVSDQLNRSKLFASRMREAQDAMNSLASLARDGELETYPAGAEQASDQLLELGVQLQGLAAEEAIERVASLRDLTASLANLESELAKQRQSASPSPADDSDSPAENSLPQQHAQKTVKQLQRRSKTVDDLLNTPAEIGDAETSEVNDRLQRLAEENEFSQLLAASQEVADEPQESPGQKQEQAQPTYARAMQYAEIAVQLDQLFRQLSEPRLARLRQLEQQASALALQMQGGAGEQGENAEKEKGEAGERSPEVKAAMAELERQLRDEGLQQLAEMLQSGDQVGDAATENDDSRSDKFDPTLLHSSQGRVLLVVREIQARIQEMILQDITPDRDIPVPPQYQRAVDHYLRVLAGEAATIETPSVSPAGETP
ncbi:hypothetical protein DTL42_18760 [Bremerella cremea]|uniref:DUF4175 family protein n=1 Tax=Bremerella cremea TaxID=1031537 RepID=A0A368KMG9_9BACT|nr:hypothetical protein [Bremerella cremea]RCS43539.1 hypothetical protein DTL42_18760 [Bremerella cremea]